MRVLQVEGEEGLVEMGGVRRKVSLLLLEGVQAGDYVIVHAGFAISRLDPEEAQETLAWLAGLPLEGEEKG